jgi:hypothetical protein
MESTMRNILDTSRRRTVAGGRGNDKGTAVPVLGDRVERGRARERGERDEGEEWRGVQGERTRGKLIPSASVASAWRAASGAASSSHGGGDTHGE